MTKEQHIEQVLIAKLRELKYIYRDDIRDKVSLAQNFLDILPALKDEDSYRVQTEA